MLRILPTGMCFFPVLYSMLVNVLFASCMSVGGCSAAKASSVSCVNLCLPSCSWYMIVCSVVLCVCCQSVLLVVLVGGLSLVHELSSRSSCCRVRMIWW